MTTKARQRELELLRNIRRNKRYKEDPEYRKHIRSKSRERYVARNGKSNCSREAITKPFMIQNKGLKRGDDFFYDANQAAIVLGGYNVHVIYRWVRDGHFPPMIHKTTCNEDGSGGMKMVYSLEEMTAITNIMHDHQINVSCYFGKSQPNTVAKIKRAIEEIRAGK